MCTVCRCLCSTFMAFTNTLSAICLLLSCASACDTTEVTRCSGSSGGSWYAPLCNTLFVRVVNNRDQYVHTLKMQAGLTLLALLLHIHLLWFDTGRVTNSKQQKALPRNLPTANLSALLKTCLAPQSHAEAGYGVHAKCRCAAQISAYLLDQRLRAAQQLHSWQTGASPPLHSGSSGVSVH